MSPTVVRILSSEVLLVRSSSSTYRWNPFLILRLASTEALAPNSAVVWAQATAGSSSASPMISFFIMLLVGYALKGGEGILVAEDFL